MNIVLNLLEEFIGWMSVTPPRRGGTPPSGELLRNGFINWIQNCWGGFEEYSIAWFDEYCIEFVGRMSVTPPRRGGTPPSGELLYVKREMSRITVYGWVWDYCVVFGLRNGFMKLDTKLLGWVWGILCCIWFMNLFYEIGYKIIGEGLRNGLLYLVWEMVWEMVCCIWFEKWFEKWFDEIGYKIVGEGLRKLYWICFMKLDTKLLGWVWEIFCCIWFEKWFEKLDTKLLGRVWGNCIEFVLWNWIQSFMIGFEEYLCSIAYNFTLSGGEAVSHPPEGGWGVYETGNETGNE
jgi:hypothetical protein